MRNAGRSKLPPAGVSQCAQCGADLFSGDKYCSECGAGTRTVCAECGYSLEVGDKFCPSCSAPCEAWSPTPVGIAGYVSPWRAVRDKLRRHLAGEFRITRELGRGGQAAVFLATELLHLQRDVAIKVLAPGTLSDEAAVERFIKEARIVASLRHQNIVTIYYVRQVEEIHFFVMQYVPGRTLAAIIHECGRLPLAWVRAIAFDIGSALQVAHKRGVVHRDIKPVNIIFDDDGSAIVTDFGIAKNLSGTGATATRTLMGTPPYMSPEQCRQDPITWSSDQYSLGIVIFEMLTGRVPFQGSDLAIMNGHTAEAPALVSDFEPELPAEVDATIARMLAKRPSDRWPSMRDALEALGAHYVGDESPVRRGLERLAMSASEPQGTAVTPTAPPPPLAIPARRLQAERKHEPVQVEVEEVVLERRLSATPLPDLPPREAVTAPLAEPIRPDRQVERQRETEERNDETPELLPAAVEGAVAMANRGADPVARGVAVDGRRRVPVVRRLRRALLWSSVGVPTLVLTVFVMRPGASGDLQNQTVTVGAPPDDAGMPAPAPRIAQHPETALPPQDTVVRIRVAGIPEALVVGDGGFHLRAIMTRGRDRVTPTRLPVWRSSNETVATIDTNGRVVAVGLGESRISVTVGETRQTVLLRVGEPAVSALSIVGPNRLTAGTNAGLRVEARDQRGRGINASNLVFETSDPSVATIDGAGTISALRTGNVIVTARAGVVIQRHSMIVEQVAAPAPDPAPAPVPPLADSVTRPGGRGDGGRVELRPRPPAESKALLPADVVEMAERIGTLVIERNSDAIRQLYQSGAEARRLNDLLKFLETRQEITLRRARFATTGEDVSAGRTRAIVEFDYKTAFSRARATVTLFLQVASDAVSHRLVSFSIGNASY